jgi:UDP-N-acetylmuramoyl-L-alanyl-D-glutamate--2,6-diaminopimelate ligase
VTLVPRAPEFARAFRTVGVTGTNGKTSTTTWVAAALATIARPVARATTIGYWLDDEELDLPKDYEGFLDLMRACLDRGGKLAAIELTSEALARGFMTAWPSQVGVFTNLTHDHLDAHGSAEHYLASKAQLFLNLPEGGTAVLNGCDPAAALIGEIVPGRVQTWRYGISDRGEAWADLDLSARAIELGWEGTRVEIEASGRLPAMPKEVRVRAIGAIYAENALAALLGAVAAGADPARAAEAIAAAPPPPGRFELVHERPYVVVDYAHSPDALARTVAIARALAKGRLTVVFGAGGKRDKAKRAPMGEAARPADRVILTTDNPRDEDPAAIAQAVAKGLAGHPAVETILDRAEAIARATRDAGPEDVVLIAGKGHETEQTIGATTRRFSDAAVARAALGVRPS